MLSFSIGNLGWDSGSIELYQFLRIFQLIYDVENKIANQTDRIRFLNRFI